VGKAWLDESSLLFVEDVLLERRIELVQS